MSYYMAKIEAKQSANVSRIIKVLGSFLMINVTIDVNTPPLKNKSKIPKQLQNLNSGSCSDIIPMTTFGDY